MSGVATFDTAGTIHTMDSPEDLEQRLSAGDWLEPAEAAALLDVSKSTVVRMLNADPPVIRFRRKPGTGRHRELNPEDVRRELDARREVHGEG